MMRHTKTTLRSMAIVLRHRFTPKPDRHFPAMRWPPARKSATTLMKLLLAEFLPGVTKNPRSPHLVERSGLILDNAAKPYTYRVLVIRNQRGAISRWQLRKVGRRISQRFKRYDGTLCPASRISLDNTRPRQRPPPPASHSSHPVP